MSQAAVRSDLVARTVAVDGDVDLVAFAGDDGVLVAGDGEGLAGRGAAALVHLPRGLGDPAAAARVSAALAGIGSDDEMGRPGCGPVAIGALPFDPHRPCSLVVPEVLVGRSADGVAWTTTVTREGSSRPSAFPLDGGRAAADPDGFTLTATVPHDEWCRRIDDAVATIRSGDMAKVVLAREVVVEANRPIVRRNVLERLRALYPSCTVFSVDGFVGASPELLVARRGGDVWSHPMAGTVARSGDPGADARLAAALLSSVKEVEEHRMVIDAVTAALSPLCEELDVPPAPAVVPLRNVSHLATRVQGRLRAPGPDALALAALLHPTPAVGGTPTAPALTYLAQVEGFDRGRYAGPVGWVDARGDGTWMVGIRSADIDGNRARLFAGVGVVEGSVAADELAETQLKLQALLAAVVRP